MENSPEQNKKLLVPTASAILDDDTIVETIFQPDHRRTAFAIYNAGRWTVQDRIDQGSGTGLVPFSPNNNLVKNEVVLFPAEPQIYGSEASLVAGIQDFIRRYVDFSPTFLRVATYYVLLTWLYDAFNELPYLRLRGDYGSGKTRALSGLYKVRTAIIDMHPHEITSIEVRRGKLPNGQPSKQAR